MKKLILLCLLCCLFACNKEKSKTVYPDLMFFSEKIEMPDGNIAMGWLTEKTIETTTVSKCDLLVLRSGEEFYPQQQARIMVDKTRSTAKEGTDFKLTGTDVAFGGGDQIIWEWQLEVLARNPAESKKIVLKLDYGYEDLCPSAGRSLNVLTITLQ